MKRGIFVFFLLLVAGCGKSSAPAASAPTYPRASISMCGEIWNENAGTVTNKLGVVIPNGSYVNPNPSFPTPCTVNVIDGVVSQS